MRTLLTLALLLVCLPATAQPIAEKSADDAYLLPFGSEGNTLELLVANTTGAALKAIEVVATEQPAWLSLPSAEVIIESLEAGEDGAAVFGFSVSESAAVGEAGMLRFEIRSGGQVLAEKVLRLAVEAPKEVTLRANYPNPFMAQTTIGYELPASAKVTLRVYDVLGREVASLVEAEQAAGYHAAAWEAGRYASGVYLYRLDVQAPGRNAVKQGRMLLVK